MKDFIRIPEDWVWDDEKIKELFLLSYKHTSSLKSKPSKSKK